MAAELAQTLHYGRAPVTTHAVCPCAPQGRLFGRVSTSAGPQSRAPQTCRWLRCAGLGRECDGRRAPPHARLACPADRGRQVRPAPGLRRRGPPRHSHLRPCTGGPAGRHHPRLPAPQPACSACAYTSVLDGGTPLFTDHALRPVARLALPCVPPSSPSCQTTSEAAPCCCTDWCSPSCRTDWSPSPRRLDTARALWRVRQGERCGGDGRMWRSASLEPAQGL